MKRRDFIQQSLVGAILPTFLNGFSVQAMGLASPEAIGDDNVLVIIQLNGGNDGLNTVIPIEKYAAYSNARGTIAIPEAKALSLTGQTKIKLHPSMTGLQSLYNDGKAAIIQGVGYPNPNFSHFRATDIWNSGSEADQVITSGWAGRYLSFKYPNFPNGYPNADTTDPLAIQIGSAMSMTLQGPVNAMGMSITNPTSFYNLIQGKQSPVPNTPAGDELSFLRTVSAQTNLYASVIKNAAAKVTKQVTYPANNGLAAQLKIVAQLIGGGLKTKVYMVNIGSFDTHAAQTNTDPTTGVHATLLQYLSDGIKSFMDDLKGLGVSKKVLGMTYSEFGRRIKANASGGTDHGTTAPMFVFGDMVNSSVIGNTPNLPDNAAVGDNLDLQHDFRTVYETILENWFCLSGSDSASVMLKNFAAQNFVKPEACGRVTAVEPVAQEQLFSNYPNPFADYTTLQFKSNGGHVSVQIFDNVGHEIAMPVNGYYPRGNHEAIFDGSQLPTGLYYARFQNDELQQVRKMVKG